MNFQSGLKKHGKKIYNMGYNNELLNNIQKGYLEILLHYEERILNGELDNIWIIKMIDEIEIYWCKNIERILFELNHQQENLEVIVLSGAMYLDIENDEHYYIKLLGDSHVVSDSMLKMANFFRIPNILESNDEYLRIFKKCFIDTLSILKSLDNSILILPIELLSSFYMSKEEKFAEIEKFYWFFISNILETELLDKERFDLLFNSIETIEERIKPFVLENLIFDDINDRELSLKDRCMKYKNNHPEFGDIPLNKIFHIATYSYIAQNLDIIFNSVLLNVIPFIRHSVSFNYFLLLKDTLQDVLDIKEMIDKTMIINLMYNTISLEEITKYNYQEYLLLLEDKYILKNILDKISSKNLSFVVGEIKTIREIIIEEIETHIK